jgi:2-polyprenyl-3-methyl-5-hydroxy-6-metoxy-1,4-benzoquinol methylase
MNALGMALTAYHSGQEDASFTIVRDDGFEQTVRAKVFFDDTKFPALETCALDLCRGQVLDVGAAAGRHSLELHRRGLDVWSLDILPETQPIMSQRGVPHPLVGDILSWAERSFDTVLTCIIHEGTASGCWEREDAGGSVILVAWPCC